MNMKRMSLGPLGTNCYIVYKGNNALIIDPGGDEKEVISFLDEHQLKPLAILLTHAHFDHIGAVDALRHFYHMDVYLGEDHTPETHLFPIVLLVALGICGKFCIFGDVYQSHDGTCVRDYIHVTDLADAHVLAINKLRRGHRSSTYNLGNGNGFTVKEVIDAARNVTGKLIPVEVAPRRVGDPAKLVASSEKAINELGWQPRYTSLEEIIESAWNWFQMHPGGYSK